MPKYVIERDIKNAGKLSEAELREFSQKARVVIESLGPSIQWLHSYVTDDKLYCVYVAPNKEWILEHARRSSCPANRITEVKGMITPTTVQSFTRNEAITNVSRDRTNSSTA